MADENRVSEGSAPAVGRRGPLNTSNPSAPNAIEGEMAIGPCRRVDRRLVELLREITQKLYAVVAASRTVEPKDPDQRKNARQHILIATLGIAATQAETTALLISCDLHKTAEVHVRSLGEFATRCKFLLDDKNLDLALEIYKSLEASRKALISKMPEVHELRAIMDQVYAEVDGPTMEKIESRMHQYAGIEELGISTFERKFLSKWAHGDIVALADAGDRIRAAAKDLQVKLNDDPKIIYRVLRAITFALILLACGPALKVDTRADVRRFAERSEVYARATPSDADHLLEAAREQLHRSTGEGT